MPCRKYLIDVAERKKNKYRRSSPATYSRLPLTVSTCGETDPDVHALIKELHRMGREQVGEALREIPASGKGDGISTSSAGISFSLVFQQAL